MSEIPDDDKTWHIKVRGEDDAGPRDGDGASEGPARASAPEGPAEPFESSGNNEESEDPVVISVASGDFESDPPPIVLPPIEESIERSKYVELLREHRRVEDELKKVQSTLYQEKVKSQAAEERVNEHKNQSARVQAEFSNYRRRTEKEREDSARYAFADLLCDLLPVLDNFYRAMSTPPKPETLEDFHKGMTLIHKQLEDVLVRYELRPLETIGVAFDPNFHEAVTRLPSPTIPMDHVVQDLQRGYLYKDRLLRPALVAVSEGGGEGGDADDGAEPSNKFPEASDDDDDGVLDGPDDDGERDRSQ